MWDKPELMNAAANLLFGTAALLAFYAALALVIQLPVFPLREVRVSGELAHVTRDEVEELVRRELRGNFFTLDLGAARGAFERLSWVRKVNVRRRWPDRLEVVLEEHVPLARWSDRALVNTRGEVFEATYGGKLPRFVGPAGAAKEMAIQYEYFRTSLAAIGLTPVAVQISQRRAWRIQLATGLTLELGREQVEARLTRFVAAYGRTLARLERRIDYVDLRYANGFAVRIPDLGFEKPESKRRHAA